MQRMQKDALLFLLRHLLFGSFGGFLFGALILVFDVAGLGTLVRSSPDAGIALLLLFFGLFVTFGSVGMGAAVMSLGRERD